MIKLFNFFFHFFLIGSFTVGGGYAMIPMIRDYLIGNGYMTKEAVTNFIAIGEMTPGPFAVNTATLVGFSQFSQFPLLGAVITTIGVVLPSFLITLLIAKYFHHFSEKKLVIWIMAGIKATVISLIIAVVWDMTKGSIFNQTYFEGNIDIIAIFIFVVTFTISRTFKKIGPIPIILISGFLGFILYGVFYQQIIGLLK